MDSEALKNYAIGTLTIALLVSLGFNVQPEDTHVCRELEITKYCNRLSSTEKTCYPTAGTRIGSKYCSSGWEEIMAEPEPATIGPSVPYNIGTVWKCSVDGCIQIK